MPSFKLSEDDLPRVEQLTREGKTQKEIGAEFGVDQMTVSRFCRRHNIAAANTDALGKTGRRGAVNDERRNFTLAVYNSALGTVAWEGTNTNSMLSLGAPVVASGIGYHVPFSMQFSLDQVINYTDFTAMFDKYRIAAVKVTFRYNHNVSTVSGVTSLPSVYAYVDNDDSTVPTQPVVRENMLTREKRFTSSRPSVSWYFRPRPVMEAFPLSYVVPRRAPFLDAASISTPHYGLKGYFANALLPAEQRTTVFNVDVTYYIALRHIQ